MRIDMASMQVATLSYRVFIVCLFVCCLNADVLVSNKPTNTQTSIICLWHFHISTNNLVMETLMYVQWLLRQLIIVINCHHAVEFTQMFCQIKCMTTAVTRTHTQLCTQKYTWLCDHNWRPSAHLNHLQLDGNATNVNMIWYEQSTNWT